LGIEQEKKQQMRSFWAYEDDNSRRRLRSLSVQLCICRGVGYSEWWPCFQRCCIHLAREVICPPTSHLSLHHSSHFL